MEMVNYMHIDHKTSYWDSIDMMTNYFRLRPYNKDEILLHLNNTKNLGYVLLPASKLNDLRTELEYYKRLYEKTI